MEYFIMSDYQNRTPFLYAKEVKSICKPLFENTPIDFLEFIRSYDDGSYLTLCTNVLWLEYYFENKLYQDSCFHGNSKNYKKSTIFTDTLKSSQNIVQECGNQFHIHYCLASIQPGHGYVDTFIFGTSEKDNKIYDFYLNNMDLLDRFIFYFYDQANDIIIKHLDDKFKFIHSSYIIVKDELKIQDRKPGLKRSLEIDNYILQDRNQCRLSNREVECLHWIEQGKSCDEVGIILNISGRTVESHLSRVKKKLNCYKTSQLISLAKEYGVL